MAVAFRLLLHVIATTIPVVMAAVVEVAMVVVSVVCYQSFSMDDGLTFQLYLTSNWETMMLPQHCRLQQFYPVLVAEELAVHLLFASFVDVLDPQRHCHYQAQIEVLEELPVALHSRPVLHLHLLMATVHCHC